MRLVAADRATVDEIADGIAYSVAEINRQLGETFFEVLKPQEGSDDKKLWLSTDGQLKVMLLIDRDNQIAYLDVEADNDIDAHDLITIFSKSGYFISLNEHIENAKLSYENAEGMIVRVILAAVGEYENIEVQELLEHALCSENLSVRNAGAYGVLVLRWPSLCVALDLAIDREVDVDLKNRMENVRAEACSRGGPTGVNSGVEPR